jgi:hypothetical protein
MSTVGARPRNGRGAPLAQNPPGARVGPAGGPALDNTPYRLLWSTGIAALALAIAAFVLWGFHGAGTLFDMMVVFCS